MTTAAVCSRVAAAALGGYFLANALAIFLSRLLPVPRADAVLAAALMTFALYAAAVLWVFAARSASRAWLGMLIPGAVFSLLAWMLGSTP